MITNHKASYKGHAIKIKSRNLTEAVCEKFKIYRNGDELRFHYHDGQGQVVGAKTKTADKEFKFEGEFKLLMSGNKAFGSIPSTRGNSYTVFVNVS